MKKIYLLFFAAGLLVTAQSCERFLDRYPESEVSVGDYLTTSASLNNAVMGCYNGIQGSLDKEWSVTELRSDNTRLYGSGSSSVTTKAMEYLDQGNIPSTSDFVDQYWKGCYKGISRCNLVLQNLDIADEGVRAQYEAEALFVRAYHYFNIVRLWGPAFIVTKPTSAAEARYMQRSPKEDVYALIEGDLEKIVDGKMLPLKYSAAETGRATLTAAKALLAKVYMTAYQLGDDKYAKAQTLLEQVLEEVGNPTSSSALVPYDKIFATDNEMNAEIIFACRYKSGNIGLGSPFGNYFAPINNGANVITGSALAHNYPSNDIIAAFNSEAGDLRKDVCLQERYYNKQQDIWVETGTCRYVCKYLSPVTTDYDGESDWPIIRVGDVVLLYAEILNELGGPSQKAVDYLNMTRNRAGLPSLTLAELSTRYAFREALRKERRLELAFENHRWFDLMRWGIAKETVNDVLTDKEYDFYSTYTYTIKPIDDWQVMLPVPISILNINPEVAQNVGY